MLIHKGGRKVEAGTYFNPADGTRVKVEAGGALPGDERVNYIKFSHTVALIAAAMVIALMSMAFPYGIGLIVGVFAIALIAAIGVAGAVCVKLAKEALGQSATFHWNPSAAYLSGKKGEREKKGAEEKSGEEKKN